MKIYINDFSNPVKAEILPNNTPTKDETLETFSFALLSNDNPLPLAPMQQVKIDFVGDGSDVAFFYIVSDSVETFSLKPLRYKHNLTCIQNTRKLSKHLVRNSVFTQPGYLTIGSFNAESAAWPTGSTPIPNEHQYWNNLGVSLNWYSEKITLNEREKIKSAKFKISFQYIKGKSNETPQLISSAHSLSDILNGMSNYSSGTFADVFYLKYTDQNNQARQIPITPSTFGVSNFDLNGLYDLPVVVDLANQGCNNFEIYFDALNLLDLVFASDVNVNSYFVRFWMCQVELITETYYWSCYDILNLLIERQKKETLFNSLTPLFSLPQSGDLYELLKKTIAPNFTFTQLTMYECVAEVFRLFDAIFTMDENGVLGIEYFNDLSGDYVSDNKFTGRTLALGEDKYTNGLVAHYQDARVVEKFPINDGFANLRSVEFGVAQKDDHNFITPHKIENIIKFEVLVDSLQRAGYGDTYETVASGELVVDITRYILERDVWSTLPTGTPTGSDRENRTLLQSNTLFYSKGDNVIPVAYAQKDWWVGVNYYVIYELLYDALIRMSGAQDSFYLPSATFRGGDWKNMKMRITYTTSVDGKAEIHSITNKYNGETLIDQANGAVDLNKMGLNMLGLSLKLGNPTLNATHKITSWANRIKTGQLYNYQGKLWVANVVSYTFFNGQIQGKVSFVQNFNALALRTQLLREKRMSNISRELVQKSEEIITDYVYFFSYIGDQIPSGEYIHFDKNQFKTLLVDTFSLGNPTLKIGDAYIYHIEDVTDYKVNAIYIPMIKYGAGNTINFEVSFEHPMNAGNKTVTTTNWTGSNRYYTTHVIYTDENGFLDTISVRAPVYYIDYTQNFPEVEIYSPIAAGGNQKVFFEIRSFKVYKQPNEIFALNYQLAFLPLSERENIDFIGNEFINNNAFVNTIDKDSKQRYIAFSSKKTSNIDIKFDYFLKKPITSVSDDSNVNYRCTLNLAFATPTSQELAGHTIESWAIIDERDNVLFASNNTSAGFNGQVKINFVTMRNRLN